MLQDEKKIYETDRDQLTNKYVFHFSENKSYFSFLIKNFLYQVDKKELQIRMKHKIQYDDSDKKWLNLKTLCYKDCVILFDYDKMYKIKVN
jgi:hypothetical protein